MEWLSSEVRPLHPLFYRKHTGRIPGVGGMRTNSFAWAFNAEVALYFFPAAKLKCPLPLPIAVSFRERAHAIQTASLVGLDEWDGQERKVVCREEEEEEEVEEDEAQEAARQSHGRRRCVLLCRINYERRKAAIKPAETRGDDLADVFARGARLLRLSDNDFPPAR